MKTQTKTPRTALTRTPNIVTVMGYRYAVEVKAADQEVILWSLPEEYPSSSREPLEGYGYTHGGDAFCAAVDRARELAEELGFPV